MEAVYSIIGKVIVWGILLLAVGFILFVIIAFIGVRTYNFFKSDWLRYQLGRTYETDIIRRAYQTGRLSEKQKSICFKYRLRNIKNAKV
jgi:hypothetical protein